MTKQLVLLSTLVVTATLVITGALYLHSRENAGNVHFRRGLAASELIFPTKDQPEERIIRHPKADGSAVDDVLMRDGTTKRIVYDRYMRLRQVFAYFKGPAPDVQGPLMYEKTHDDNGHLASERHLRADGSLEMDGHFNPDNTYVRHLYYSASALVASPAVSQGPSQDSSQAPSQALPQASSQASSQAASPASAPDPKAALVVSSEQTFDKLWKHTSQTDFRPDGTKQLVHTWGAGSDELVTTLAKDGKIVISSEGTKSGKNYTVSYYPDGQNIKMDVLNNYEGTTIQWYRLDQAHTLTLKVTFDNSDNDQIVIPGPSGKPLINQVWSLDNSGQPYPGPEPRHLDHIDHFNDAGTVDIRYDFDRTSGKLTTVTYYQGDKPSTYGARVVYTVGPDGFATGVKTFDATNKDDGGKPIAQGSKQFVLAPWMVTRPKFEVPTLKDGLKLYGEPPQEEYDFD